MNRDKCYRCYDQSLLKLKHETRHSNRRPSTEKDRNADDSWKDLEATVASSLNDIRPIKEARRARASGALWFEKGDIVDEILHPECKERTGNDLVGGEKSISIKSEWLEKAAAECKYEEKTMCLPFRYKGKDKIYCIFDFDDIAELISTMKSYMQDNDLKDLEIQRLKKLLEEKR
jgi:hypothetical protein